MTSPATERFIALVRRPEAELPLDEAALLIAAHAKPALRVEHYLGRLDELASMVDSETLGGVLDLLYRHERFRGNDDDYYDERNSYLDEVLDRRVGIPITLAVVLMEVGRRVGIRLAGLNTPGHFLVAHLDDESPPTAVDPFTGMVLPDVPALAGLVAGPRLILARMLGNLRQIHGAAGDRQNLGWVLRLRAAIPDLSVTERAEALAGLGSAAGQPLEAADGLEELADEAATNEQEAEKLRARATQLRAKLN